MPANWQTKRKRRDEVKARAAEPSHIFSRCRVVGCDRPARAGTEDGLDTRFCRSHSDHYSRHGSPYRGSYTANELAPYRRAAMEWLEANEDDIWVSNAVDRVATLYATAGPHIEAFRLRGLSPPRGTRKGSMGEAQEGRCGPAQCRGCMACRRDDHQGRPSGRAQGRV